MKGAIENCCRAEQEIMKKVREAYENDVAAMSVSIGHLCLPCSQLSRSRVGLPCGPGTAWRVLCGFGAFSAFGIQFIRKRFLALINRGSSFDSWGGGFNLGFRVL